MFKLRLENVRQRYQGYRISPAAHEHSSENQNGAVVAKSSPAVYGMFWFSKSNLYFFVCNP